MRFASGKKLIEAALEKLGVSAPGEPIEELLIEQSIVHANAKLEALSVDGSAVGGVTIQDLAAKSGQAYYWIGPSGDMQTPPGLKTSGTPQRLDRAVTPAGGGAEAPFFEVAQDYSELAERKNLFTSPYRPVLFLHGGSGSALLAGPPDERSYAAGNRRLEIYPAPSNDYTVRLYLEVPEIQSVERDAAYDLPPGIGEMAINQIALALATVHGVDGATLQALSAEAGGALAAVRKQHLRHHAAGIAHLDPRWVTSVSVGDDYVHYPEYD